MGIEKALPILRDAGAAVNINDDMRRMASLAAAWRCPLAGRQRRSAYRPCAVVDVSCWIHEAMAIFPRLEAPEEPCPEFP